VLLSLEVKECRF